MENGRELERIRTLTTQLAECRAELGKKDMLLRDIHHRIKNNLQVVASLISLQTSPGMQPEMQMILDQLQGRVHAIAALHQTLYSSPDLGSILFGSYMQQLLRELLALHAVDRALISIEVQAADIVLSIEQALPLGLILTELMTNCLKHAFLQQQQGTIVVSLRYVPAAGGESLDDAQVELSVSDNGTGMAAGPETESLGVPRMGLHMVELLVAELNGSLEVTHDHERGAKFIICFPLEPDELKNRTENVLPRPERGGLKYLRDR